MVILVCAGGSRRVSRAGRRPRRCVPRWANSIVKYYLQWLQVRKCNIVDETRTETTRVPERKCEKVPSTRRKCGTVTVPQPPMEVTRGSSHPSLY